MAKLLKQITCEDFQVSRLITYLNPALDIRVSSLKCAANNCLRTQVRIKVEQRGQLIRTLASRALRDEIYLFQIKYSFEQFSWFRNDTRIRLYIMWRCCIKYREWFLYKFGFLPFLVIATEYKYFRFCSMQIYVNFAGNVFLIIVLLAWVWFSTRASRLLHKCHEYDTFCVLKLVLADCCSVSVILVTSRGSRSRTAPWFRHKGQRTVETHFSSDD